MWKINFLISLKGKQSNNTAHINNFPEHMITLNDQNFKNFINQYPLCMIDFWAPWCHPCQIMNPRLRRLTKLFGGKVAFGRLNTQENQKTTKEYKIVNIPHLILFKFGKKVTEITGVKSIGDVKNIIEKFL
jgi:thioredoxin 1